MMWTLSFTMKCHYFGPVRNKKRIKFIDVHLYNNTDDSAQNIARVITKPGLTANGEPTSSNSDTIEYQDIEIDDDWGIISIIQEYNDITET